jgi:hydrogenase expression/formation protein HypC
MMCLAVAAQVVGRAGNEAVVDLRGSRLTVSVLLVPEVEPGDWVLVHAGFAIQRVDATPAELTVPGAADHGDADGLDGD